MEAEKVPEIEVAKLESDKNVDTEKVLEVVDKVAEKEGEV